jgi:signal transduction histidine kinase
MRIARRGVPAGLGDWAIAAGVMAVQLSAGLSGQGPSAGFGWFGYVLLAVGGLVLVARRRAPIVVLVVTGWCAVGCLVAGFEVLSVSYLVAVYGAVRAGRHVVTAAGSVVLLAVLPVTALVVDDGSAREAFAHARGVLELAWLIAAFAAGEALRQAERRAEEAERTREETARRRADEERLHIARELHDSLTHQISVIKVQAEVAVHLARKRREQVPQALLAILEAAREATRELRVTLGALRENGRTLAHGLDHVPELVQRARAAGLDATLTIEGRRAGVPAAVDRAAYRIVQESLTNIARHAAAATACVQIGYLPDALAIRVDDDGKGTPGAVVVPGVGLLGMRERVTALGGRLRAEPRGEGGFTVQAELPTGSTP